MIKSYKGRTIAKNRRVQVYRNLHQDGVVYSVKQGNKVVAHATAINLYYVRFNVGEEGRKKVVRNRRKEVHAFVTGYIDTWADFPEDLTRRVRYNPYEMEKFQCEGKDILKADFATINEKGVFV